MVLSNFTYLPKLVVFDLDGTVWDGDIYLMSGPPFNYAPPFHIGDRKNTPMPLYAEVQLIFEALLAQNIDIAYASRTTTPEWSKEVLKKVIMGNLPALSELSVADAWGDDDKHHHLKDIHTTTGIDYRDMLFFDNEWRNIPPVNKLGVHAHYCPDGLSWKVFVDALTAFQKNRST